MRNDSVCVCLTSGVKGDAFVINCGLQWACTSRVVWGV